MVTNRLLTRCQNTWLLYWAQFTPRQPLTVSTFRGQVNPRTVKKNLGVPRWKWLINVFPMVIHSQSITFVFFSNVIGSHVIKRFCSFFTQYNKWRYTGLKPLPYILGYYKNCYEQFLQSKINDDGYFYLGVSCSRNIYKRKEVSVY